MISVEEARRQVLEGLRVTGMESVPYISRIREFTNRHPIVVSNVSADR